MSTVAFLRFVSISIFLHFDPIFCFNSTSAIKNVFDEIYSKIGTESAKTMSTKTSFLNCTRACSFSLAFNDTIQQPANCSVKISSFKCLAQVSIFYHTRQIFVTFRTTGAEADENGYTLYAIQQFLYIFNFNYTTNFISFVCFFGDNCDWKYIETIIKQFVKLDIDSLYYAYRALLYDPNPSTSGIQCSTPSNTNNCSSSRCVSSVDEDGSTANGSCATSTDPTIGLDIRRRRIFPTPPIGNTNTFTLVCNRDLCNDALTRNSLKRIMEAYATATQIPTPTSKSSPMPMISNLFLIIFHFAIFFMSKQ